MEKLNLCNVLIFVLPGSGKTTFAHKLRFNKNCCYFNGDEIRSMFNEWEFKEIDRTNQAIRMQRLCEISLKNCIVDFICPFESFRTYYNITVWMNTVKKCKYADTNQTFEKPEKVDYEINNFNYDKIVKEIRNGF